LQALVTGINLILQPEISVLLSDMNFLSPDGVCYSFDHRRNGYGRGEGMVAVVLKPVVDAIKDGDMIRAIIRSTGSNQDGRTSSLTQPSANAQKELIRDVYLQAGLDFESTRYFEAHGSC
jgi:acyl transferase domain-containing protein